MLLICLRRPWRRLFTGDHVERDAEQKIVLPGGAGLVGQNLVVRLKERGYTIHWWSDKHLANLATLGGCTRRCRPSWLIYPRSRGSGSSRFASADVVVMLQAQIGGNRTLPHFERNNMIDATYSGLPSIGTTALPGPCQLLRGRVRGRRLLFADQERTGGQIVGQRSALPGAQPHA